MTKAGGRKHHSSNAKREPASKPYTGILAEPVPDIMLLDIRELDSGSPPKWWRGSQTEWAVAVERTIEFQHAHLKRCFYALADHYRITLDDQAKEWGRLAMALAIEHVPALQIGPRLSSLLSRRATSRGQPTRLDTRGTVELLLDAAEFFYGELDAGRKRPSGRKLAAHLATRSWARRARLEPETIRTLWRDLGRARLAIAAGNATEFQRQFVEVVIPLIQTLPDDLND